MTAQPHPDFWHPDGSVVVEAENTKFKLHQSMLQRHSAYFASLFQKKGMPSQGGRAYLEVEVDERSPNAHIPVYRVSETTAEDFAALLTVIEEPMKYTDEAPPMPILAGVLRSARALSFDAQRKWAERVFERMWPATLDAVTDKVIPHASAALALARTYGIHSVRKRASYELLRMPALGQSTAATASDADSDVPPHADLLRLLHAREQLCLFWTEVAGKAPTEFPCLRSTENDRVPCAMTGGDRVHARWAELVHASGVFAQRMLDPLMGLQDLVDMPWRDEGFCKKCVAARANEWTELRKKLWSDLDVWLELTTE
ncbi:hypothetical protein BJY52DRAFT_201777 [Lactarius psammicola]|nr:hypothetical protein BJY52DRAFT_201777 [Lactarius psammicola]